MRDREPTIAGLLMGLLLAATPALWAQGQAPPPYQDQPPPDYSQPGDQGSYPGQAPGQMQNGDQGQAQQGSVARLSLIQGAVSTQRGDSGDWSAATLNTPVVPGDRISTGEHARAELQLDYANILRLDENTVVRITDISDATAQIEVAQGLVSFSTAKGSSGVLEIDTPNLAIHPWRDGVYRIEVTLDGRTLVAIRRGQAEVGTADGSATIRAGQLITVQGDAASAEYQITAAPARDSFDLWNTERDKVIQQAQSWQHLNENYTGAQDLDNYGSWQNVPDYGDVWTPSVPQTWAPYRDGSWVWEPGWGWTWVSYEPWGWAPYHYGRWFLYNGAWAWWPGPVTPVYRPVWAPAYVSFFGFGGAGWGVSVGFGGFGWLPIGPCDPFYPWWGGWGRYYGHSGYGHWGDWHGGHGWAPLAGNRPYRAGYSNLHGLASNSRLQAGMTAVSANRFGNGRMVGDAHPIGRSELQSAQAFRGSVPVVPSRASLSASGRPAAPGTVPSRNLDAQHFFQRNQSRAPQHNFAAESAHYSQQLQQQHAPAVHARGNSPRQPAAGGASGRSGYSSESRAGNLSPGNGQNFQQQGNSVPRTGNWSSFSGSRGQPGAGRPAVQGTRSADHAPAQGYSPQAGSRQYAGSTRNAAPPQKGWQHFSSQPGSRTAGHNNGTASAEARPPLTLHKSIVQGGGDYNRNYGGANARGASQGHGYPAPHGGNPGSYPGGGGGSPHGGSGGGSHGGGHGRP